MVVGHKIGLDVGGLIFNHVATIYLYVLHLVLFMVYYIFYFK